MRDHSQRVLPKIAKSVNDLRKACRFVMWLFLAAPETTSGWENNAAWKTEQTNRNTIRSGSGFVAYADTARLVRRR